MPVPAGLYFNMDSMVLLAEAMPDLGWPDWPRPRIISLLRTLGWHGDRVHRLLAVWASDGEEGGKAARDWLVEESIK